MGKSILLLCMSFALLIGLTGCKENPQNAPAAATPVSPSITQHPANVTLMVGQTATFTISATGTGPLSYQWQKDGTAISSATSASYTLVVSATDSGKSFRCVVSNSVGSATSNPAILNAVSAATLPVITGHPPTNVSAFAGDTVTLSVSATATHGGLNYQWQKNGVNVAGATSASYTFVAQYADSGKSLRCVVSNTAGSATSNPTVLSVIHLIQIGRPYRDGAIFYVDGTGQHGLYLVVLSNSLASRLTWQNSMDTASVLGGVLPTITQLQMIYPNRLLFELSGDYYWSSQEAPNDNRFALSLIFNSPNNPQLNGQVAHSWKTFVNYAIVVRSF